MIKICKYFLSPFKKNSQCFGTLVRSFHFLSNMPVMTQWILTGPARVEWLWSMTSATTNTIYGTRDPALVDMWGTSYQNMKYQSSLRRCIITGRSQRAAWVSQRMECQIGVIVFYVSANSYKVTSNIDHVSCIWIYMLFVCGIEIDD